MNGMATLANVRDGPMLARAPSIRRACSPSTGMRGAYLVLVAKFLINARYLKVESLICCETTGIGIEVGRPATLIATIRLVRPRLVGLFLQVCYGPAKATFHLEFELVGFNEKLPTVVVVNSIYDARQAVVDSHRKVETDPI